MLIRLLLTFSFSIGNGPTFQTDVYRKLSTHSFVNMSGRYIIYLCLDNIFKCVGLNINSNILHYVLGSLQFKSTGITPGFNISFGNHLGKSTVGYLTYSSAWKLSEYNDVSTSIIIGAQTRDGHSLLQYPAMQRQINMILCI